MHGIQAGSHVTPNKQETSDVQSNNEVECENTVHLMYDSGADGHYVSKDDRKEACMPILRSSSKKVGVANGDTCKAKHATRLPFPQLSKRVTKADTFTNLP